MAANPDGFFAGSDHDHGNCVATALDSAASLCQQRGVRLTPMRRQVLELVWQSHQPIGAYSVLDALQANRRDAAVEGRTGAVAPPTVYRALEFLLGQRLIHRIESLNAYIGCVHPGARHAAQFLICNGCGSAAELESAALLTAIDGAAADAGFAIERVAVEVAGQCPDCRGTVDAS
ncbi:MAG: Fur family zinc uptake transcriptional regulator [Alphaproteobacteria bacterium]|jgi:Fur family zinc uptake transcriptional regulator